MKRIIPAALLVLTLVFLPVNKRSFADQKGQQDGPTLQWKTLDDGIKILRLWESVGPLWPQIAVLRLPKTEYEKFLQDPVSYLNAHKVYPPEYPAKKFVPCDLAKPDPTSIECILVLKHDPDSTSSGSSSCSVKFGDASN